MDTLHAWMIGKDSFIAELHLTYAEGLPPAKL